MMMLLDPNIRQRAEQWIQDDPNTQTANAVQHLIDQVQQQEEQHAADDTEGTSAAAAPAAAAAAAAELCKLFPADPLQRISFGTAGLRGPMMPGPLGMNDLVVVQAAQGLAEYCLEQQHSTSSSSSSFSTPPQEKLCAVVGYDHRANPSLHLSSISFALLTALVFIEAGMDCFLLDGFVATPLVPFCLSRLQGSSSSSHIVRSTCNDDNNNLPLKAVVGIMITASHNPKQDAGYKVYWSDGCQIRSPVDQGIAASIQQNLKPWKDYRQALESLKKCCHPASDPCLGLSRKKETQEMIHAYFAAIKRSGLYTGQAQKHINSNDNDNNVPKFCYTAMHGVGYHFAKTCFQETFGLPAFESVPEQQEPDPTFPTVAFPNPEEHGALDLAMKYAEQHNCHIVLANDPDADRLAVAEYNPSANNNNNNNKKWTTFTGDQIGVMLGHWLWTKLQGADSRPVSMCMSTVSSKMLAEIGRREGFHVEETLTGFKWIGSRAAALQASSSPEGQCYRNIFCYEEAIGFCCGNVIFDKDGITACAVMAELALHVYCEKRQRLADHMQSLYDYYGEFLSHNGYFFLPRDRDPLVISTAIFNHITNQGHYDRKAVGRYEIESIRDLGHPGYDSTTSDKKPTLPTSKSSPMLTLRFTNGCVAQFRSSGTEPKFKYYIELRGQPGVARSTVQDELDQMSAFLLEELIQPAKHELTRPASKL